MRQTYTAALGRTKKAGESLHRHSGAHTVRIRKAVQRKTRSRFMLLSVLCLAAGILIGMMFAPAHTSEASMSYDAKLRYTSVRVEEGMTLTALAQTYNTEHRMTNREYIEEVQRLNGVYDNQIMSGSYLTIPYYEREMH